MDVYFRRGDADTASARTNCEVDPLCLQALHGRLLSERAGCVGAASPKRLCRCRPGTDLGSDVGRRSAG